MTQLRIDHLREQVEALQRVTQASPGSNAALPGLLAGLHRSLTELRDEGVEPTVPRGAATPRSVAPRRGGLRAAADETHLLVRSMDRGGSCRWANRSWCAFTGRRPRWAQGDGWLQDVHPDDRVRCADTDTTVSDGTNFHQLEYQLRRATGEYAWVREHRVPRFTSTGRVCGYVATAVDVSPRGRVEHAEPSVDAHEPAAGRGSSGGEDSVVDVPASTGHRPIGRNGSAGLLQAALREALPDAVLTVDHEARVLDLDPAAEALFRLPARQAPGCSFSDLIASETGRQRFRDCLAQQLTHPRPHRVESLVLHALRADGSSFPARLALTTSSTHGTPARGVPASVRICVWDDTPRSLSEHPQTAHRERVQSLLGDLLMAEERERKRLARDLHDGLSQTIALAQVKLSALRASRGTGIEEPLDEIRSLLKDIDHAARSVGFELCPMILHDLGLEPALDWLADNISERYGIAVELDCEGQVAPDDELTRVIVFRAVRELLINAAKHAGVQQVQVHLVCREGLLHATVVDDGVGIDPSATTGEGFGLLSVRERMAHIGGRMTIDSMPDVGTTVHLRAPVVSHVGTHPESESG